MQSQKPAPHTEMWGINLKSTRLKLFHIGLEASSARFDLCVLQHVLCSTTEPGELLEAIRRLLRPGLSAWAIRKPSQNAVRRCSLARAKPMMSFTETSQLLQKELMNDYSYRVPVERQSPMCLYTPYIYNISMYIICSSVLCIERD